MPTGTTTGGFFASSGGIVMPLLIPLEKRQLAKCHLFFESVSFSPFFGRIVVDIGTITFLAQSSGLANHLDNVTMWHY